jgi:hypothetical protein
MISIDNQNYQEFHFLSTFYREGITDIKIYTLFLTKVLSELQPPVNITISELGIFILKKHGIEIPPTFIKEILTNMSKIYKEIVLKKDKLNMNIIPELIINDTREQQKKLDSDTSLIYNEFKYYMYTKRNSNIGIIEFNTAFSVYCKLILKQEYTHTTISSVMTEWIFQIYHWKKNLDLVEALDRMIYSWLIYTYYYSIKRSHKKLYGFQIVFDTNIITNLLNINRDERKNYVEYLLTKIKINNCSVVINSFTIKELNKLLNTDDLLIKLFRNEFPGIIKQIRLNPEEYFKNLFLEKYGIRTIFKQVGDITSNDNKYMEIINDLRKYKSLKNPTISDYSVLHDIMLVHSFGDLHKITNIYSDKRLIGTCDNQLYNWFGKYLKHNYNSDFSYLLSLNKLNLIFWIETDKANTSNFLSNTWMYVTEVIGYFKNRRVDDYFKKLRDEYYKLPHVPENWRSLYILIENEMGEKIDEINEDDIDKALGKINIHAINENEELRDEIKFLLTELDKIKSDEKNKSDKEEVVVINNVEKQKSINDYSLLELVKIIIKKILNIFKIKYK